MKSTKKFILYLGINDKDTNRQKVTTRGAIVKASRTISLYADGATIDTAKGVYKYNNGLTAYENTLKIEILFITEKKVMQLIEKLKLLFNQESIGLQVETIKSALIY